MKIRRRLTQRDKLDKKIAQRKKAEENLRSLR